MTRVTDEQFKLSSEQIERIVNRVVPLIASPEDHETFRALLTIKAEESTSSHFAYFMSRLLKKAEKENER